MTGKTYSYEAFCLHYRNYKSSKCYTSYLNHRPGETMEVDYSGPSMYFTDKDRNKKIKAYLFVACMPYSQKIFVKATVSMNQDAWIQLNVDMLNFYKGIPVKIVCDNLKTGVLSHPKNGPIELNPEYLAFADYYNVAIIPTGVRKPKEKASVEGSVGKIATKVIAKLRNETFYSLDGLNHAIFKAVEDFNNEEFQKRKGSRNIIFETEEKGYLRALPLIPYEVCSWNYKIKVMNNSHVTYKHNFYSVPYQYIGQNVDIKVNKNTLFIYNKRDLICQHLLLQETIKNEYVTDKKHLDPRKEYTPYTYEDLIKISQDIGENTLELVNRIFSEYKTKEQGFNDVISVLNIRKIYSNEKIEKASKLALKKYSYPHYKQVLEMIDNIENSKEKETLNSKYVRGASYYKKGESK